MKTKEKELHYGKALLKAIETKGFTKVSVFKRLGISKPTLNTRLIDGDFTLKQKRIIEDFYL